MEESIISRALVTLNINNVLGEALKRLECILIAKNKKPPGDGVNLKDIYDFFFFLRDTINEETFPA